MSTYIIFNRDNGEVVHVHREYYMDSDVPVDIDVEQMWKDIEGLIPEGIEADVIAVSKPPEVRRGFQYYVDLTTRELVSVEKPKTREGAN